MSAEIHLSPAELYEIRSPRAEIRELLKIQEFNIQAWKDTYLDPGQPQITEEWIEGQLRRVPQDLDDVPSEKITATEELLGEMLNEPGRFIRIALDEHGEIVGIIHAFKSVYGDQRPNAGQDCVHLEALFIRPDQQGKGLGKELMNQLDVWRDPALDLELEVATYTPQAHEVYKKRGYVDEPNSEHRYEGMIPMTYMVSGGKK